MEQGEEETPPPPPCICEPVGRLWGLSCSTRGCLPQRATEPFTGTGGAATATERASPCPALPGLSSSVSTNRSPQLGVGSVWEPPPARYTDGGREGAEAAVWALGGLSPDHAGTAGHCLLQRPTPRLSPKLQALSQGLWVPSKGPVGCSWVRTTPPHSSSLRRPSWARPASAFQACLGLPGPWPCATHSSSVNRPMSSTCLVGKGAERVQSAQDSVQVAELGGSRWPNSSPLARLSPRPWTSRHAPLLCSPSSVPCVHQCCHLPRGHILRGACPCLA